MLKVSGGFSSFSTNDLEAARDFYGRVLGLRAEMSEMGLSLTLAGGGRVFIYPKPDHEPATFTVLNLFVSQLDAAVDALAQHGVRMQQYDGIEQDERGIAHDAGGGPDIAWFTDPAGNVVSILEDRPLQGG